MRRTWVVAALTTALATSGMGAAAADAPADRVLGETSANEAPESASESTSESASESASESRGAEPGDVSAESGTGADGVVAVAVSPLPVPKAAWPTTGRLTVYLCSKAELQKKCEGRGPSDEQKRKIERLLKRLPGLSGVRYVSAEESYRNAREDGVPAKKGSIPASFRADVKVPNVNLGPKLAKLPGIATARVWRTDFWAGKAHAKVELCGPANCSGRGAITDHERDAVFEALRTLPGVKKVYLESRGHAIENWRRVSYASTTPDVGEIFHLVLSDPSVFDRIRPALRGLPGVEQVSRHR
ncbi:hypothetical protein ACIBEJ_15825 [Nonomuraea sp. NPDC050790]|uniref:hypothetical protein n=1 Tax=Nonomuraea sp. NPDC050790 TaxID=3364371 RepID=UPI0037A1B373